MLLIKKIRSFFNKLFGLTPKLPVQNFQTEESIPRDSIESIESIEDINVEKELEQLEQFKIYNVIFEKLNYLEQYIKIFSLNFPEEYSNYLSIIQNHRQDYEDELKEYQNGFSGELTFAINPEHESQRLIAVSNLENEIKEFVDLTVNYSIYNDKFSKMCNKLNQFYNALLDTKKDINIITSQLNNATDTLVTLIDDIVQMRFFDNDTRKREVILNYIIYCEYILFKSSLRCNLTTDFNDYKSRLSKFHYLFIDDEYNRLVFNFFIEDLEQHQLYITTHLVKDTMYDPILRNCQKLQTNLNNYSTVFGCSDFFEQLIRFENTIDNIADNSDIEFKILLPKRFEISPTTKTKTNDIALSVLSMLSSNKAKILAKIIHNFSIDISWREFFFLCKIFELDKDVINISQDSIFENVKNKFSQLASKYTEYSDQFILSQKEKLLNYSGSKTKKYIVLMNVSKQYMRIVINELQKLRLDFCISDETIYLNHSYFNGFKNLEKNFGKFTTMEEIL